MVAELAHENIFSSQFSLKSSQKVNIESKIFIQRYSGDCCEKMFCGSHVKYTVKYKCMVHCNKNNPPLSSNNLLNWLKIRDCLSVTNENETF